MIYQKINIRNKKCNEQWFIIKNKIRKRFIIKNNTIQEIPYSLKYILLYFITN